MYKKQQNAYMTLEASLILPVIFAGIIFAIYVGIYFYDISTMKQVAYIGALRGSQLVDASAEEIKLFVEQQMDQLLDSKILIKEDLQKEVKVSHGKIKVKIIINLKIPLMQWIVRDTGLGVIEKEAEAVRVHPVNFIREVRKRNEGQISERFVW